MNSNFKFHYNFGKVLRYMNSIDTCLEEGDTQNAIKWMMQIQMVPMSRNLLELTGVEEFLRRISIEFEDRQGIFATQVLEEIRSAKNEGRFHEDDDSNVQDEENTVPRQNQILNNILEDTLLNIATCKDEIEAGIEALDLRKLHEGLLKLERIPMCVDLLNRSGIKDFVAELIITTVGELAEISFRIWKHCRAVTLDPEQTVEEYFMNKDRSFKLLNFYIKRINGNLMNPDETSLTADILKLMKIPLTLDLIIKSQIKICLLEAITINFTEVSNIAYKVLKKIKSVERIFLFGDKLETLKNEDNLENNCENISTNIDKQITEPRFSLNLLSLDDDEILLGLIVENYNPNLSEETESQNQDAVGVLNGNVEPREISINSDAGTSFNCSNTLHPPKNPLKSEDIDGSQ